MIAKPLPASTRPVLALLLMLCGTAAPAQTLEQTAPAPSSDVGGDPAVRLSNELRVLAGDPRDLTALDGAGRAALDIGDFNGALGFFGRAEQVAPRDGPAKAGLAAALVQLEQPRRALPLFAQALQLGVPVADIAADRGLAYDLTGDPASAQRDYELALARHRDDETLRRYALSLGISGKKDRALDVLDPLVRRSDPAGWRARAFVLALDGDTEGANTIVAAMLPSQSGAMKPFLAELAKLTPAQQAAAVNFGDMPASGAPTTMLARRDAVPPMPASAPVPVPASMAARPAISAATVGAALVPSGTPLGTAPTARLPIAVAAVPQRIEERPKPAAPVQIAVAAPPPPPVQVAQPSPVSTPQPRPASEPADPSPVLASAAPVQVAAAAPRSAPPPAEAARPGFSSDATDMPPVAGFIGPPPPSPVAQVAIAPSQPVAGQAATQAPPAPVPAAKPAENEFALAGPSDGHGGIARTARPESGAAAWRDAFGGAGPAPERDAAATGATKPAAEEHGRDGAAAGAKPKSTASASRKDRAADGDGSPARTSEAGGSTGSQGKNTANGNDTVVKSKADRSDDGHRKRGDRADDNDDGGKRKPGKAVDSTPDTHAAGAGSASDAKTSRDGGDRAAAGKHVRSKGDDGDDTKGKASHDAEDGTGSSGGRVYVQVAGGANKDDMPKAWAGVRKQAPDLMKGRSPSTTPLRFTNRLLVGPFKDQDAAQDFVNKLAGKHMSGSIFTSAKGQKVEKVPADK